MESCSCAQSMPTLRGIFDPLLLLLVLLLSPSSPELSSSVSVLLLGLWLLAEASVCV
jgi:hypothetical protein